MHYKEVKRRTFKDMLTILVLFILIRIVIFSLFDFSNLAGGDSSYYSEVGKNIVNTFTHGEYSSLSNSVEQTVFRPPFYSAFVGVMGLMGDSGLFVYIYQSTVYFLFAIFCYFILKEDNIKIAFLSVLLIAVSPFEALYNGRILSENIVTPLLVSSSLLFAFSKTKKRFFLSGVLIGATILTRDVYILLPFLFIFAGFFGNKGAKNMAAYILGFFIVISPWVVRNINLEYNSGAFISKGIMWPNLWAGLWIKDHKDVISKDNIPQNALNAIHYKISEDEFIKIWSTREQHEAFFKNEFLTYSLENPLKVIHTWISRYHLLWLGTRSDLFFTYSDRYSVEWYLIKYLLYILNFFILFLSMVGLIWSAKSKLLFLTIPIIYSALIYIPLYNIETRYTQPIYPILLMYVAYFMLNYKKILSNGFFKI